METGTIKDIQNYLGECEFPCTSCGSINTLEELIVQLDNNRAKATCAHCETFIKWLPAKKIDRVFWKGNMTEIAKIETSLLMWMVNNQFGSHSARRFIRIELMTRVDASEIDDFVIDRSEQRELDEQMERRKKLAEYKEKALSLSASINKNSAKWDYYEAQSAILLARFYKRKINKYEEEIQEQTPLILPIFGND